MKSRQLNSHMEVLVTYNFWDPRNRGYWFQGKVEKVRPTLSTVSMLELTRLQQKVEKSCSGIKFVAWSTQKNVGQRLLMSDYILNRYTKIFVDRKVINLYSLVDVHLLMLTMCYFFSLSSNIYLYYVPDDIMEMTLNDHVQCTRGDVI